MGQEEYNTKEKKWTQLTERDRYKIEALNRQKLSAAEIGMALDPPRDRRTIERELRQGTAEYRDREWRVKEVYYADTGQRRHDEKAANKGRGVKIAGDHQLIKHIEKKIKKEKYSPEAVIGEIKDNGMIFRTTVCAKTIYNMIDKKMFKGLSNDDLPVKRDKRKRKYKKVSSIALHNTRGRSIEERPKETEKREESGHWEMDCVMGKGKVCLLVMTERKYRTERIFKMASKTQENVLKIMDQLERKHKSNFNKIFKSITMDNGSEFLDMNSLERSCLTAGTKRTVCYYTHPYSAFERGSNEVANKLIRRFIPKGADISKYKNDEIKRIEYWINNYPRKIFGYMSSSKMKQSHISSSL